MPLSFRRSLPIAGAAVILMAASASAQTPGDPNVAAALGPSPALAAPPHVRAEAPDMRLLAQELSDQSPTARALIARLERSNVIVYIRFRAFASLDLDGRVGLLSSVGGRRYLVIELACARPRIVQLVTLAHELHHSVEIADAPAIVDTKTLSEHYARIGIRTRYGPTSEIFETFGAQDTGTQVRRELLGAARTTNERE
jgi:hypothetical protein